MLISPLKKSPKSWPHWRLRRAYQYQFDCRSDYRFDCLSIFNLIAPPGIFENHTFLIAIAPTGRVSIRLILIALLHIDLIANQINF
jgi:hypothetical protein